MLFARKKNVKDMGDAELDRKIAFWDRIRNFHAGKMCQIGTAAIVTMPFLFVGSMALAPAFCLAAGIGFASGAAWFCGGLALDCYADGKLAPLKCERKTRAAAAVTAAVEAAMTQTSARPSGPASPSPASAFNAGLDRPVTVQRIALKPKRMENSLQRPV